MGSALPKIEKIKNIFKKCIKVLTSPKKRFIMILCKRSYKFPANVLACRQVRQAYFYTKTVMQNEIREVRFPKLKRRRKMTKTEFIAAVAEKTELTKKDTEITLNAILDTIQEALAKSEKI